MAPILNNSNFAPHHSSFMSYTVRIHCKMKSTDGEIWSFTTQVYSLEIWTENLKTPIEELLSVYNWKLILKLSL